MSEYDPTPAYGFPMVRRATRHCPRCRMSLSEPRLPAGNPLREFCPACLVRFIERAVPRMVDTPVAPTVASIPSAKSVTDRIDEMVPNPLARHACPDAQTVRMDLNPPPAPETSRPFPADR